MKPWMKILMWFGLGGGIGFFAGYQIGGRTVRKDAFEEGYSSGKHDRSMEQIHKFDVMASAEAAKALDQYRGEIGLESAEPAVAGAASYKSGWSDIQAEEDGDKTLWSFTPSEDPEMPEEPPVIGDEAEIEGPEIPELHPQHLIPRRITEQEYYENPNGYDQESLFYYTEDQVLFNKDTRKAIDNKDEMDEVVGIGMMFSFYQQDGEVLDAIFVENATMGVIFRIDRIDAAYSDPVSGANADEYEEDDTE